MKVLVTGAAGFIGMHVCQRLLERGDTVFGIDDLNDYYDPALKRRQAGAAGKARGLQFRSSEHRRSRGHAGSCSARRAHRPSIHLAAQAGVRYSLQNPAAYIDSNLAGFGNVLEGCRHHGVNHLVYASSSSVYGGNKAMPFSEHQNVDHPVSLYAATKKANELMAHSYSHLFRLPTTGLRFFTVYGPWGRPDMALFLFTKAMLAGRPIDVFNNGEMLRGFTYIDDIVEGVIRVMDKPATPAAAFDPAQPDPATSNAPYRVFNIGNSEPVPLMAYIAALEKVTGIKAQKNFLPMQPGDVQATSADTAELDAWVGFKPETTVEVGVERFYRWYHDYYRVSEGAQP